MADLEQWVNLTRNNKWKGEDLDSRWRMGPTAILRVRFAEARRAVAFVTKEPADANAEYSPTERPRRRGFRVGGYERRRVMTDRNGVVDLSLDVNLAGGDEWDITVEDRDDNEVQADTLLTRRKLYYQVVRMENAADLTAASKQSMQDEFWGEPDDLYIRMVEISPGETIPDRRNYDDIVPAVVSAVRTQLLAVYDRSKEPYSFVTMLVRRNGVHMWEERALNNVTHAGGTLTIPMRRTIFDLVDPADPWFGFVRWTAAGAAGATNITQASTVGATATPRISRGGPNELLVNFSGLPDGPGRLHVRLKTLCVNGRGMSTASNNLTLVATEDAVTGNAIPQNQLMGTLVHEIAHKIGMLPGGPVDAALDTGFGDARPNADRSYLDRQSSYYWARGHNGGHCHTGAPLLADYNGTVGDPGVNPSCTMFGDDRTATHNFCDACKTSVRKLDLRSRVNRGLRTRF